MTRALHLLAGLPVALLLICGRPSAVRHILNNGVGPVVSRGR